MKKDRYIIRAGISGEWITAKCIVGGFETHPDIRKARKFSGARARRWAKRHSHINPIIIPFDPTK